MNRVYVAQVLADGDPEVLLVTPSFEVAEAAIREDQEATGGRTYPWWDGQAEGHWYAETDTHEVGWSIQLVQLVN